MDDYRIGYVDGTASRDAEVAELQTKVTKFGCVAASYKNDCDQLREQVKTLLGYCEDQMRKDKAISYERCPDCDYDHKCSREVGCLGIKDHSPIMSKALAATEPK